MERKVFTKDEALSLLKLVGRAIISKNGFKGSKLFFNREEEIPIDAMEEIGVVGYDMKVGKIIVGKLGQDFEEKRTDNWRISLDVFSDELVYDTIIPRLYEVMLDYADEIGL